MREGYEPLAGRRRAVVIAFGALVLVSVVAVWVSILDLNLLDRLESGALVGDDEIDANDSRVAAVGLLQMVLYITCAIVFIPGCAARTGTRTLSRPGCVGSATAGPSARGSCRSSASGARSRSSTTSGAPPRRPRAVDDRPCCCSRGGCRGSRVCPS